MPRGLPLQPELTNNDPHRWRWRLLIVLLIAVLFSTWLAPHWQVPPRLLTNRHQEWHYLTQLRQHIAAANHSIDAIVYVAHIGNDDEQQHPFRLVIADLAAAQQRGVNVRVILDRSPDWGSSTISPKNDPTAAVLQDLNIPVFGDEENRTTHCKSWVLIGAPSSLARTIDPQRRDPQSRMERSPGGPQYCPTNHSRN